MFFQKSLHSGTIETFQHTSRDAQRYSSVLIWQEDLLLHQVDFELSFGPDVRVTQAVACCGTFSGNLTSTSHGATFRGPDDGQPI